MKQEVLFAADLKVQVGQLIGTDLADVNVVLQDQLTHRSAFISDVTGHVARFSGKQIRPVLLLLSARVANGGNALPEGERRQNALRLSAVIEMIHTATLVHDDILDDADTRRHLVTVHRRWDTETSVLLGDFLFSKAYHLAACTGDADACRLIGRATDRTCEGELRQIEVRLQQSFSERDYLRVVAGKTGQLFAVCGRLGARVAGADRKTQIALQQFGLRLGIAFQIADDVLDLRESDRVTGKDAASDLQNQRLTLPILKALRAAQPTDREALIQKLFSEDPAIRESLRQDPLIQEGILAAERTAERYADRALHALRAFSPSASRRLLESIAAFAVRRRQ